MRDMDLVMSVDDYGYYYSRLNHVITWGGLNRTLDRLSFTRDNLNSSSWATSPCESFVLPREFLE